MTRYDDGYEAIKLVMDDYELGDNENDLDDVEDAADENYPDELGSPADGEDDSDAETEYADKADVYALHLDNERREEIETLTEQLQTLHGLSSSQSPISEMMMMNMMINLAEARIIELRTQLGNSS